MERIERDKLVEIYYNEVLEKFLKPIIEKKVTILLATEMSRVIEVADKEDITIKIITQPTNFIWISVLCRLSHSSAEFHLSYNDVFNSTRIICSGYLFRYTVRFIKYFKIIFII